MTTFQTVSSPRVSKTVCVVGDATEDDLDKLYTFYLNRMDEKIGIHYIGDLLDAAFRKFECGDLGECREYWTLVKNAQ